MLADQRAADAFCAIANEAAVDLKHRFNLPVSLIWIDTLITAAGFASGEDNDAAAAQRVMTALRNTSQRTGVLAIGIDHFGKVVETGTRGSSAKQGAALRRVLTTVLAGCGQKVWPFPDGPEVCACDLELVRPEFYRQYPADGTAQQKAEGRRKAFGRSVKESIARGVVGSREVDDVQFIWLATLEGTDG